MRGCIDKSRHKSLVSARWSKRRVKRRRLNKEGWCSEESCLPLNRGLSRCSESHRKEEGDTEGRCTWIRRLRSGISGSGCSAAGRFSTVADSLERAPIVPEKR